MTPTSNISSAFEFLSLPNACPLCVVAVNPQTGNPIAANSTFESIMGPLYKFKEWEFANSATEGVNPDAATTEDGNRSRFREAIDKVRLSLCNNIQTKTNQSEKTSKIRNVEMLTLGAGIPIRKYFDWTLGSVQLDQSDDNDSDTPDSVLIMYGDVVNEVESKTRARDAELIDFFQNAPIALHWLNSDGIVLWANQTELNVLGYEAEEYIGQPIMNFCPDERELVLEIFKQLGSGNTIADVPVRFRTKDNKLVHLLIDSNVAYNTDGSFGHTRCFIRDDTARKIKDARTTLLLEENERSLRMLDSFLSRTLHHVMGPLHTFRGTCELVSDSMRRPNIKEYEIEKNCELLERAAITVSTTTRMVADVSDLARFHDGATLKTTTDSVAIRGLFEAVEKIHFNDLRLSGGDDGINISLNLIGGGPSTINTDRKILMRVLAHLLENAVREVGERGEVKLQITSSDSNSRGVLFEVIDNGKGLPGGTCLDQGDIVSNRSASTKRYVIGQRDQSNDPDEIQRVRTKMEEGLKDLKHNGVGVGLRLSYHLVSMLGGDLRHDPSAEQTRIWFHLPKTVGDNMEESNENIPILETETIYKKAAPPVNITIGTDDVDHDSNKRQRINDADFGNFISDGGSTTTDESPEPAPQAVVKCGVRASMPFSVLIVEDTNICARLLAMQLKKMNCSTQRAENGRVAVDLLKDSLPGTFDFILMDLRMPVMDGIEATKLIRNELQMSTIPICALTGEMGDEISSECEKVGFTEFFQKPLPRKTLQELITKYKEDRNSGAVCL